MVPAVVARGLVVAVAVLQGLAGDPDLRRVVPAPAAVPGLLLAAVAGLGQHLHHHFALKEDLALVVAILTGVPGEAKPLGVAFYSGLDCCA